MAKVKLKATKADVEQANTSGDFEPPKPGLYIAELTGIEPKFTQVDGKDDKSRPYLNCIWHPIGDGREGTKPEKNYGNVWDVVSFGESSGWKRAQFALALGIPIKNGEFDAEIEIEAEKPGTVIGTKCLIRVKKDSDLEGNYKAKIGWMGPLDGDAAEPIGGDPMAVDGDADADGDSEEEKPFADATDGDGGEEEFLTAESIAEQYTTLKEMGDLAKEFDLDPHDHIVKVRGKLNEAKTKEALTVAILEAQGAEPDADVSSEDENDPF